MLVLQTITTNNEIGEESCLYKYSSVPDTL